VDKKGTKFINKKYSYVSFLIEKMYN